MSLKNVDTNTLILAYGEVKDYINFLKKEEENSKK